MTITFGAGTQISFRATPTRARNTASNNRRSLVCLFQRSNCEGADSNDVQFRQSSRVKASQGAGAIALLAACAGACLGSRAALDDRVGGVVDSARHFARG